MPSSNYNKVSVISDCHLHSDFSSDSSAAPRDIIERALSLGLRSICFTDHNDFDYPLENGRTVFNIDLPEYIRTLKPLADEYRSKPDARMEIQIGVEQGLMKSVADQINAFDSGKELDFIIGSSHLVNGADPYYPSFWEGADVRRGILLYYESILENLQACSNFDVYGHIDYIVRYIPKERADEYRESDYYEILDAILRSIIAHEKGIEINTAGFKYNLNRPNPSEFIIKRYRELGGEIITVGSDAHEPRHMAYCFDKVPDILKTAGFKYYTRFIKRAPEFISLD